MADSVDSEERFTATKAAVSYMCNTTTRNLTHWQNQKEDPFPIMEVGKRGTSNTYDLRAVMEWRLRQQLRQYRLDTPGEDGKRPLDLDEERARLASEQADRTALQNAQLRKELAPIMVIKQVLASVAGQVLAIFGTIPGKVKQRLPQLSQREIELIQQELVKAGKAISNLDAKLEDFDVSSDATADTDA